MLDDLNGKWTIGCMDENQIAVCDMPLLRRDSRTFLQGLEDKRERLVRELKEVEEALQLAKSMPEVERLLTLLGRSLR